MRLRPPVKWHGGKYYLSKELIPYFPEHHTYLEPYGGAASALLNKDPSAVEIYNDLNDKITNLFRVIKHNGQEFQRQLTLTPYNEVEFNDSLFSKPCDPVERAVRDFVNLRQSIGGRGDAFSLTLHRSRRHMADVVSGYLSAIDEQLPLIMDRLREVQILCRPAIEVIRKWDDPNAFIYCDPPYLPVTRVSTKVYENEMTSDQHVALGEVLKECKSKVMISGYPSELYNNWLYKGWTVVTFDIANHAASGDTKQRKQETIWMNYDD